MLGSSVLLMSLEALFLGDPVLYLSFPVVPVFIFLFFWAAHEITDVLKGFNKQNCDHGIIFLAGTVLDFFGLLCLTFLLIKLIMSDKPGGRAY